MTNEELFGGDNMEYILYEKLFKGARAMWRKHWVERVNRKVLLCEKMQDEGKELKPEVIAWLESTDER